ncbi:MAG TPA: hypothetical protein V6D48_21185, partial [Oculatellaceae cyanobacterium]
MKERQEAPGQKAGGSVQTGIGTLAPFSRQKACVLGRRSNLLPSAPYLLPFLLNLPTFQPSTSQLFIF